MTSVLVDGRSLSGDGSYRGFGRYLAAVLPRLAAMPGLDVSVLALDRADVPGPARAVPLRRRAPGRLAGFEHWARLPRDISRVPTDVFHSPGLDPPRRCHRPWVQTLHDVIPLVFESEGYASARRVWRRRAKAMRRATAVIANSEHTARQGADVLGLDRARVHVVPMGVDARFTPGPARSPDGRPFILYVGEYGPNKGYREAFEVVAALAAAGLPHTLKVAGRVAPWIEAEVEGLRAGSGRPERVEILGYIPDDTLIDLYRAADALVVTSRAEGFGMPTIEAMACGAPVVAFDNTALPEVVGGAGVVVPDGDVAAFAAAVRSVVSDRARREELVAKGLARAAQFDWDATAAAHAEIYRSVAGT